jgi:hypothetical protein
VDVRDLGCVGVRVCSRGGGTSYAKYGNCEEGGRDRWCLPNNHCAIGRGGCVGSGSEGARRQAKDWPLREPTDPGSSGQADNGCCKGVRPTRVEARSFWERGLKAALPGLKSGASTRRFLPASGQAEDRQVRKSKQLGGWTAEGFGALFAGTIGAEVVVAEDASGMAIGEVDLDSVVPHLRGGLCAGFWLVHGKKR